MNPVEINIREDKKIIDIWLTNDEQNDESISARLKLLFDRFKDTEYTVAVFKSGCKDLYQGTLDLCQYNRNRMAAAQIYRERMTPKSSSRIETDMDAVVSENAQAWVELAKGPFDNTSSPS